ncbi:hypothetical protein [Actinoplanes sp. L3-i22]|uniref:hypothetical protein n=1 Tax=Actinoplanes sp. L3-i22 TaxID=2836373 RepID=UPI001C76D183|nr:hypothetical protein [Actinoplanes sp. L3-i22]BCY13121.1 hypothetical protein L3i22_082090 [Actinoplanes sp. L3-i22]
MTGETWPAGDARLERRYRLLLRAYSGWYRRRHGTELITTLLEMAEPGRSRPSRADAWHLITSGLRQRFRLPSGRPFALVAAVLVTAALGVAGAAAGSWLGARTFADLPTPAAAQDILDTAVTDPADLHEAPRSWSQPGSADFVQFMAFPRAQDPGPVPTWTVEQARDGLVAAGWKIKEFTVRPIPVLDGTNRIAPNADLVTSTTVYADPAAPPIATFANPHRYAVLTAERDGLILHATATDAVGGNTADPAAQVYRGGVNGKIFAARTVAYLPLTVAGALLGALAGWLLSAACAYRVRPMSQVRRRTTAELTAIALAAWVLPAFAIVREGALLAANLGVDQPVHTLHSVLRPGWWYLDSLPAWLTPICAITAVVVGLLGLISTGGRSPSRPDRALTQPS